MNLFNDFLGGLFILLGFAYLFAPKLIYPFDQNTIMRRGTSKELPPMTKEWLNGAKLVGFFFVIVGIAIVFFFEILHLFGM